MNNLRETLDKYNYKANKVSIINNIEIIDTNNGKLVVKKNNNKDMRELFKYLNSKNFHNYLDYINDDQDNFMFFPYIDTVDEDNSQKIKDLITIISNLHAKTVFYKELSTDEIKKIYEENNNYLDEIEKYYDNLRTSFEEIEFLSPSNKLLLINISWIFHSIKSGKYFLNKWYEIVKTTKRKRICLNHGNLEFGHFLNSENKYIISWEKANNDMPIFDLLILYKNEFKNISFYDALITYEDYFPLLPEERFLFFSLILKPEKVEFNNSEIVNTKKVYELITFLQDSSNIISKYHPSNTNSESNQEEK